MKNIYIICQAGIESMSNLFYTKLGERQGKMPKYWSRPIYNLQTKSGKSILIDVTSSVSASLPPNKIFLEEIMPFFKRTNVEKVLDFGAGALRHTFPLLKEGFLVCSVEFEEGFQRPVCRKALIEAKKNPNFCALVCPRDFIKDKRKFDAALLTYVIQVMPLEKERRAVLKYIYKKLKDDAILFYMSRYNQINDCDISHQISDGFYRWPKRKYHSFYREFTTEETDKLMKKHKFRRIHSFWERGTDQMFVYAKQKGVWI